MDFFRERIKLNITLLVDLFRKNAIIPGIPGDGKYIEKNCCAESIDAVRGFSRALSLHCNLFEGGQAAAGKESISHVHEPKARSGFPYRVCRVFPTYWINVVVHNIKSRCSAFEIEDSFFKKNIYKKDV